MGHGAPVDRRHFLHLTGLAVVLGSCSAKGGSAETAPPPTPTVKATVRQGNYTFTTVQHPKSVKTSLYGINNNGDTAGYFADGKGVHGFLRSRAGEFTAVVDHPDAGNTTVLFGLNGTGDAVGYYHAKNDKGGYPGTNVLPAQGVSAFVYSAGSKRFEPIAPPEDGVGTVVPFGINDAGLVSGMYFARDSSGQNQAGIRGFVWSMPDRRFVDTYRHPDDTGEGTFGMGVNSAGLVSGQYVGKDKVPHAFIRDSARKSFVMSGIDHPGAPGKEGGTSALAISDSGAIAGFYMDQQGGHGYVRPDESTFVDLRHPDAKGDMSVCGINAAGAVVGDFYDGRGSNLGYVATP